MFTWMPPYSGLCPEPLARSSFVGNHRNCGRWHSCPFLGSTGMLHQPHSEAAAVPPMPQLLQTGAPTPYIPASVPRVCAWVRTAVPTLRVTGESFLFPLECAFGGVTLGPSVAEGLEEGPAGPPWGSGSFAAGCLHSVALLCGPDAGPPLWGRM